MSSNEELQSLASVKQADQPSGTGEDNSSSPKNYELKYRMLKKQYFSLRERYSQLQANAKQMTQLLAAHGRLAKDNVTQSSPEPKKNLSKINELFARFEQDLLTLINKNGINKKLLELNSNTSYKDIKGERIMEGLIKIIIKVVEITSKDLENMKTIISKNQENEKELLYYKKQLAQANEQLELLKHVKSEKSAVKEHYAQIMQKLNEIHQNINKVGLAQLGEGKKNQSVLDNYEDESYNEDNID